MNGYSGESAESVLKKTDSCVKLLFVKMCFTPAVHCSNLYWRLPLKKTNRIRNIRVRSLAAILSVLMLAGALLVYPGLPDRTAYAETQTWEYGYSGACTTAAEIDAAFPASYAVRLKQILLAHPTWSFKAFYTGTSWEECFAQGADNNTESEMRLSRNLVEYDTKPSSWYGSEVAGAFNWAGNSYTVLSAPNWIQASEAALRYMMDPRNWMSEEQIFQFFDQTSMSTKRAVEQVFRQVYGTNFWTRTGEESDLYWEEVLEIPEEVRRESSGGAEGDSMLESVTVRHYVTYAEAIYKIGQELGVNPVALAARIVNEQGLGQSPLISGTQVFTLETGEEVSGYYNYFNMGATDGEGTASTELIITNGLREAYNGGWNTRYRALYGGAAKYAATYIHRGQNTIYSQKYCTDSRSSYRFWHQYMQAIMAPVSAARASYKSYSDVGILDDTISFLIPVYDRMPSDPEPEPTKDGNPNYKLGGIYVDGASVPGFNTDTLSYAVETTNAFIHVYVSAYADTSTVSVDGAETNGSVSADVPVNLGDNAIPIVCTAENGDVRTYMLYVTRTKKAVYFGDVDYNGVVDRTDLSYLTEYILGRDYMTDEMKEAADINGDGYIDIQDVSYIVAYLLGYMKEIPQRQVP